MATMDAVSWKAHSRVSTSWKTSATVGVAEERWEVRTGDETEKSHASAEPDAPLGTQISGAATGSGRGEGPGRELGSRSVPPGSGGRGERWRPGFSNPRETEVNSAAAEHSASRRDPTAACGGDAAGPTWKRGEET